MEQVDRLMRQAISDDVFPGGVLLISKDGSVIFHSAYGYANIFSKRPMAEDTIFDLASLTKQTLGNHFGDHEACFPKKDRTSTAPWPNFASI